MAADFDRLQLFFESQGFPSPFASPTATSEPVAGSDNTGDRPVDQVVRAEVAALLGVSDPASVDMTVALVDLGVDSLLAVDLRKRLRRATGRTASLAQLLGGVTGAELTDVLKSRPPGDGATPPKTNGAARPGDAARILAELSQGTNQR